MAQALEDAFIAFDRKLTKEDVIETLKEMAGVDDTEEDEEERKSQYDKSAYTTLKTILFEH